MWTQIPGAIVSTQLLVARAGSTTELQRVAGRSLEAIVRVEVAHERRGHEVPAGFGGVDAVSDAQSGQLAVDQGRADLSLIHI